MSGAAALEEEEEEEEEGVEDEGVEEEGVVRVLRVATGLIAAMFVDDEDEEGDVLEAGNAAE